MVLVELLCHAAYAASKYVQGVVDDIGESACRHEMQGTVLILDDLSAHGMTGPEALKWAVQA